MASRRSAGRVGDRRPRARGANLIGATVEGSSVGWFATRREHAWGDDLCRLPDVHVDRRHQGNLEGANTAVARGDVGGTESARPTIAGWCSCRRRRSTWNLCPAVGSGRIAG
jgi:hypothetical protein